jgi:hypothetical protein
MKQSFTITPYQKSILLGSLLGDAYLYSKGNIQLEQSKHHKEYLFWLFSQLKSLTTGESPSLTTRFDKRNGREYQSYRFYTRNFFCEWRTQFDEQHGMKILPLDFHNWLDSTSLGIWFLDDGGRSSSVKFGVFLPIDNYTLQDISRIQEAFFNLFGIETRLYSSGKTSKGLVQKRLVITGNNYKIFYKLVAPLVNEIPSMAAKKLPNPFLKTMFLREIKNDSHHL